MLALIIFGCFVYFVYRVIVWSNREDGESKAPAAPKKFGPHYKFTEDEELKFWDELYHWKRDQVFYHER